ncbi:DNA recombination protein RmuC [Tenacibaculum mesophilum]|uniref:DNA recombination protein RmuC n=1 Tax=Tenacibaculum mesophilum TaxID=104268 RepID=A0AAE9SHA5_9FLAO|nr:MULTISPECIES: DNA recombination protein RmuC [Tenacibaculum]AZJ31667.1 DNA recombination protein RmuC [Tenacibaculum mesophilum]MCO7185622.1 DNA recombination protein RmuC [Tenacibaculum sp. XPcli2-G]QFS26920.1 DNA recombination protein RmuC [Tenacibaculum mesophilum]UTD14341.1 DNA recombination protein RmuC [Tenacibaculum mesophilum]SHG02191.1 DNA recombination protein RmuC [Tenacibaculum mesophilum]
MNTTLLLILTATSTLLIGFVIGNLLSKLKFKQQTSDLEKEIVTLQNHQANFDIQKKEKEESFSQQKEDFLNRLNEKTKENSELRREKEFTALELARKNEELKNLQLKLQENKEEVEKLQDKFTKEFENLANKILDEKSNKFTEQNKKNIKDILNPLQEKIQTFEKKVEDTQKESISMHSALKEQLLGLKELNAQMSKETLNLTKALKGDSKTQGNWGELVLERVLEKSGLEKDREYFVQQSFTNDEGKRIMPDVVIHLPDNKKMVVDSKVSLTAYEQYVNSEDDIVKERFAKEHVNSLKRHVEQLSEKKYEDIYKIESPDFVLLFVPIEPAFAVALNEDNTLYNKAFERNIVIVTPTTLLATLRTIDTMWNNEKQQRNALEIARQAGALYDKFHGLLADLVNIGKKIDGTKADYAAAMNKLVEGRGNLITSVEKLKKMGAKAKKALPEKILERAQDNDE